MIRIIHSADWQLGKPFGRFPDEVRAALTEARFDVIDRIGALSSERRVGHVVVAGDVFDNADPGDRVVIQALTRMERAPCHWWLMPGNHDPARADGLWSRVRARAGARVHVLDEAVPVEIEEGAWILPAPLDFRRTRDDPSALMSAMETPPGAIRIGLAHGSIVDFAARGAADNLIPPDRATLSGLDYLALGDWHGHVAVNARTAYSGTPEADSFERETAGGVLLVEARSGSEPDIELIETGRYRWLSRNWTIGGFTDFDREMQNLLDSIEPAAALLSLTLEGSASLADRAAVLTALGDDLAHRLRWLNWNDRVVPTPTDDDVATIDVQGTLADAAMRLRALAEGGGSDAHLAGRALERLYVEALRAGVGDAR